MTEQEMKEIWYEQLSFDYSCSIEELKSKKAVLAKKAYHPRRRIFRGDDCFLKILIINGKLVVSGDSEVFLQENRDYFEKMYAAWFFEPDHIRELEEKLKPYGHTVADYHHFYLPHIQYAGEGSKSAGIAERVETTCVGGPGLRWYEQGELGQFRGDDRFREALSFIPESPDMLAVTMEEKGEILGMAGASADGENMWQIGINVLPAGEHRGLGTYLVTCLKEEILRRGKVPFYGTAESHIRSQRVAVGSGFMPAWAELYTRRM